MKKQMKFISLIGTAVLLLAAVFATTSCKQNDDDNKSGGSSAVAVIKSEDGNATLNVLTFDKATGKGTCKVDGPAGYWMTGDFETDGTQVTLKNTKDSMGNKGTFDKNYPVSSEKKVTIGGFVFNISKLFS